MRFLRGVFSTLFITFGVFFLIAWAVSAIAIRTVNDGDMVANIVDTALKTPSVLDALIGTAQDQVGEEAGNATIETPIPGLEGELDVIVEDVITSDEFRESIVQAVRDAHEELTTQLKDDYRAPAPLTLTIEIAGPINAQIQDTPGLGATVPALPLEPVTTEVMDTDTFETVRDVYEGVEWFKKFALWIGLALVVTGLLLSPKRRWFITKVLFWCAGLGFIAAWILSRIDVAWIQDKAPDDDEGRVAEAIGDLFPQGRIDSAQDSTLWFAIICLVLAIGSVFLVKFLTRRGKDHDEERGDHEDGEPRRPAHARLS